MILLLFIFGGLIFAGVVVFMVFGGLFAAESDQKKAEKDSASILDAAFDGRSDVTFTINMRSLKYETVILGAKERGYKLTHQAENQYGPHTLMFEKVDQVRVEERATGGDGG